MTAGRKAAGVTTPLFAQLRDRLRAHIVNGALAAGSKLPSEAELEAEHGVSRITVRQALAELHAAGLIEKVNGKGSFVKRPEPPQELGPLTGFNETMRRRGHTALGNVSAPRAVKADARVAAALRVRKGALLNTFTIMRLVDGEPFARHTVWGSASLIAKLAAEDVETNDLITIAQDRLGYQLDHSELEISALNADSRLSRTLGIAHGGAVLCMAIVTFDSDGSPLLFNEFLARGDRFRYPLKIRR
jgi:GntR family transcriptional regulator